MPIRCFGNNSRQGTYALFVTLSEAQDIAFGRFLEGAKLPLQPGVYLYIGSALGNRPASAPLARRLVRHTTRSAGKPAHLIRERMVGAFLENGLASPDFSPPAGKKLHWHVDYLLDSRYAEITTVMAIRSGKRLESSLSDLAASFEETFPVAPGLGASDTKNGTHLFGIRDPEACAEKLERAISLTDE